MALRSAYALGLHVRNEDRAASLVKKEILGRIWWSLYSLERMLSTITGRPNVGLESDCSVPLPLPLSTEEINDTIIESRFGLQFEAYSRREYSWSERSSASPRLVSGSTGLPRDPANSGSYLKSTATVSMITQNVMTTLYSPGPINKSWNTVQKDILNLSEDLDSWAGSLPLGLNFFQQAHGNFYARERNALSFHYYSTKILITRPCLCRFDRQIEQQSKGSNEYVHLEY